MIREEVVIPNYNSVLSGMFFYPNNGKSRYPLVCKVHGLIPTRFEKEEELAEMLTSEGIAYFVFHFSGFFKSSGITSIQSSFSNLDVIITYLTNRPKVDPLNIGLYAISMGAAIAICHSSRDSRITALAMQAPLFDFSFMVNYPNFNALWEGLALTGAINLPQQGVKEKLIDDIKGNSPLECIKKISPRPILILAGKKDTFMPFEGIMKLFSEAESPKDIKIITEADHNLTNHLARFDTFSYITKFFVKYFRGKNHIIHNFHENVIEV